MSHTVKIFGLNDLENLDMWADHTQPIANPCVKAPDLMVSRPTNDDVANKPKQPKVGESP
jgi:hypothetical protein